MSEPREVQPSLELEAMKALTQLSNDDKQKVLEYIESLIILETTVGHEQRNNVQV
jgi:hypothetical protein